MAAQQIHLHSDGEDVVGSESAGSIEDLERSVYAKYPETEGHIPLAERKGAIPDGIREEIEELARKAKESSSKKRRVIHATKNATPGDAEQSLRTCLDDIRPKAFTLDLKPSDCTTPDASEEVS